ncbi:DUF896 domain-containing protein [Mesoplasma whartonense]|uniref:DUF896 domain-containing protein n=1 Tax=Mesoplasma whartonense TaxID=2878854 RepID=UPI002022B4C1|nr:MULTISPECIES: DUF896 domain-containing protein [unclassified Mesoplasma]MCL8212917.1 hypothetical protein [Mesoplasma sp. JKS002661]MCL8213167.1 hypothetical protein [Mesoplasma sp. JKS002660]MCL8216116.1 hypothetical protein [Mesoplasma sp. JKS002657]
MSKNEFLSIEQLDEESLVQEINRLTKLSKIRALTIEEAAYRELLRERFIKNFKEGLRSQLRTIKVVDSPGRDVSSQEKKEENKKD